MSFESLGQHWALLIAILPASIVIASLATVLRRQSAGGQLSRANRAHAFAMTEHRRASRAVVSATSRLEKLSAKGSRVKPRAMTEAKEALQDALALEKIADDKAQVTANQVRRVIFEEFPPTRHEKLRRKYLPDDVRDNRPFSF